MEARTINIDDGESKVVREKGKGGGDGKIIDRVANQFNSIGVPSGDNSTGSPIGRFEHKRAESRGEEGGGEEGRESLEFGFLKAENSGKEGIDRSPHIITFTASAQAANVPRGKSKLNHLEHKEQQERKSSRKGN
jgi:hypothetical protein